MSADNVAPCSQQERIANAFRALRLKREQNIRTRRLQAKRSQKPYKNKTRSSFAWQTANRTTEIVRLPDLYGPANYVPAGRSGLFDVAPVMSVRMDEQYVLFIKRPKGKKWYLVKDQPTFTRCCGGTDTGRTKYCGRQSCINCYTKEHDPKAGFEWAIFYAGADPETMEIVDMHGVDPHGRRSPGKAFNPEDRATYKLTSTIHNYRGPEQRQEAPPPRKERRS